MSVRVFDGNYQKCLPFKIKQNFDLQLDLHSDNILGLV